MIAANLVGPGVGFDCDHNTLLVLWPGGGRDLGQSAKDSLAERLVEVIAERFLAGS
jgi:phosphopantothenoylcysteine decarboxylase/phosphopantothenate--cysteine ligase